MVHCYVYLDLLYNLRRRSKRSQAPVVWLRRRYKAWLRQPLLLVTVAPQHFVPVSYKPRGTSSSSKRRSHASLNLEEIKFCCFLLCMKSKKMFFFAGFATPLRGNRWCLRWRSQHSKKPQQSELSKKLKLASLSYQLQELAPEGLILREF